MTTTETVTTTESQSDNIAKYYVVPVKTGSDDVQSILYFENDPKSDQWAKVSSKNLNAKGKVHGQIQLTQPDVKEIILHTDLSYDKLDESVKLFAAVAKTLMGDEAGHDNLFSMKNKAMTIPVSKGTVRGLILVFTKVGLGGSLDGQIMQLIASPDPEIKNSTGGT